MESSYGIGVFNRYALFYNDQDDQYENLKPKEKNKESAKKKKKTAVPVEKENKGRSEIVSTVAKGKAPKKKVSKDIEDHKKEIEAQKIEKISKNVSLQQNVPQDKSKLNRPPSEKTVKPSHDLAVREERYNRKNKEEKIDKNEKVEKEIISGDLTDRELKSFNRKDIAPAPRFEYERGRVGRARGRWIRGRGMRGSWDSRGKREYDRQSGSDKTGVKAIEKRDGAGSYNWGKGDDIENQDHANRIEEIVDNVETMENKTVTDIADPQLQDKEDVQQHKEELYRELTLDEWKKLQESNRSRPQYNLRKAGEGEDNNQWSGGVLLRKKVASAPDLESEDMVTNEEDIYRRIRPKPLPIDITFADSHRSRGRGRGLRGSRGTGRGAMRGGGSGNFYDRTEIDHGQRQSAPRVDDETDFPSLE